MNLSDFQQFASQQDVDTSILHELSELIEEFVGGLQDTTRSSDVALVALQEQFYALLFANGFAATKIDSLWEYAQKVESPPVTFNPELFTSESEPSSFVADESSKVLVSMAELSDHGELHVSATVNEAAQVRMLGRYTDICLLGVGGMGEVRRVRDQDLNCNLAMKIIHKRLVHSGSNEHRFRQEAQIVSQLQHPNILPIHELGRLPDGRLYFTMQEIRGRSFSKVIREVHQVSLHGEWRVSSSGWSFRRVIDAFRQVCEAISYANQKGVIHRDLKPSNIMVGEFGEVLAVDWGLAKLIGKEDFSDDTDALQVTGRHETHFGIVQGTPAYMSPEQARGEVRHLDHRSDIYSLGAILYEILTGRAPYEGKTASHILQLVKDGPPEPVRELYQNKVTSPSDLRVIESLSMGDSLPTELVDACEKAMARDPVQRFQRAQSLAQIIQDWLDGAKKREQALKVVQRALETNKEEHRLIQQAKQLRVESEKLLQGVKAYESEDKKIAAWEKQDKALELAQQASFQKTLREQLLQGALTHKPDLPEAHAALANHYRLLHQRAERERKDDYCQELYVRVQQHANFLPDSHLDKQSHFAYLKGDGVLQFVSDPPGADVWLEKYIEVGRRMIAKPVRYLGQSPLLNVRLPMGSYRLRVKLAGHHEVLYPFGIDRQGVWDSRHPQTQKGIALPPVGSLGVNDQYVPGGWFWSGGDPKSANSLPAQRVWVDGFIINQFLVTNREFIAFLNDLLLQGRKSDALAYVPRERAAQINDSGAQLYGLGDEGFYLRPDNEGDVWEMEYPVCFVNWVAVQAYSVWRTERDGHQWRLPFELEWEKASRGVDGRFYPWGLAFDPSWCCVRESFPGRPLPVVVDSFPVDNSPYDVRGMAGNMTEWMGSLYRKDGPEIDGHQFVEQTVSTPEEHAFFVIRGGGWSSMAKYARVAERGRALHHSRAGNLSFRLVRSV